MHLSSTCHQITFSQLAFILSAAINRVEHVSNNNINKRNGILNQKDKFVINMMIHLNYAYFQDYTCDYCTT